MCDYDKLGQFLRLPSLPKGDRDGIEKNPSYYSDVASDNEKGNIGSHRAISYPKQVYLEKFKPIATFLQSVTKGRYKGLGA